MWLARAGAHGLCRRASTERLRCHESDRPCRSPMSDEPRLEPGQELAPEESLELDRMLLHELEGEAGRLYDRHASVAVEWFPHDYIPYRLGRDFDKEPWTPDQPRLSGVAQTSFEINLLTEDNLPSYHRLIHGMFGAGDGAWINWRSEEHTSELQSLAYLV